VRDLLAEITTRVPLLGRRLLDETGQLRRFVNLYVEGEDVRRSAELDTPIREGQKVQIIQSVAGG
jgi:molybdopterin converting factor small subunit